MATDTAYEAGRLLRNTPTWRGYAVGWLIGVLVSPALVGAFLLATADHVSRDALNPVFWPFWWLMVLPFATILAAPGGLVLTPLLHVGLRRYSDQRVHIAVFGVVTAAAYSGAFLIGQGDAEMVLLSGPLAGFCAAVGRWAVGRERWRDW